MFKTPVIMLMFFFGLNAFSLPTAQSEEISGVHKEQSEVFGELGGVFKELSDLIAYKKVLDLIFYTPSDTGSKDIEEFKKILDTKVTDLNILFDGGENILSHAIRSYKTNYSMVLIEKGVDVKIRLEDGRTLIHLVLDTITSQKDLLRLVPALLDRGVDVHAVDKYKRSVLHALAGSSIYNTKAQKQFLDKFLEKNVDIDARDERGFTASHTAFLVNNFKMVKRLDEAGADPNIPNMDDKTIFHYFSPYNVEMMNTLIYLIEKHGKKLSTDMKNSTDWIPVIETMFSRSSHKISRKYFNLLLQNQMVNPNLIDKDGNSMSYVAAMNKKYQMMKLLIDAGADLGLKNSLDETPYDIAKKQQDVKAMRLLEASLNPNKKNVCKHAFAKIF